jgi:hypothetical protein
MATSDNDGRFQGEDAGGRRPSGAARLLPRVTFGLGTAVLAGVAIVSVPAAAPAAGLAGQPAMTTAGLGAAVNVAGSAVAETTCCGDRALRAHLPAGQSPVAAGFTPDNP